jgi:hypothetical protein
MKCIINLSEREHMLIMAGLKARSKKIELKLNNLRNQQSRGRSAIETEHGIKIQNSNLRENNLLTLKLENPVRETNTILHQLNEYCKKHSEGKLSTEIIGKFMCEIINE